MNDIRKLIDDLPQDKRTYIYYKFPDLRKLDHGKEYTEEEFLSMVQRKSLNAYLYWEKSPEYNMILALYLQSKVIADIYDVYEVVKDNALTGDDKSVKLLLTLNKEINSIVKQSRELSAKSKTMQEEEEDIDDGLVI